MVAAMLISGSIGWFVVESGLAPPQAVFWRCVFGTVALAAVCAWRGHFRAGIWGGKPLRWALLGGLAIVGNWLLLFAAYAQVSIAIATVVYSLQPFMLVALGALWLGERLTAPRLAWLALAFAGMLLIVQGKTPAPAYAGGQPLVGVLLALAAALLYAIAALLTKRLAGVPPELVALVHVGLGALALAPWMDASALPGSAQGWALVLALGLVHTGLMYVLLYGAIQALPTPLVGTLSFIYPVAAIGVDALAYGHRLSLAQAAGVAVVLLAAAGVSLGWRWRRQPA